MALAAWSAGGVEAAGIELVPDGLWWRHETSWSLATSPQQALAVTRLRVESEWWPLYADDRGARLEGARRVVHASLPITRGGAPVRLNAGAEVLESHTVARSGAGARGFGLEEARQRRASLGIAGDAGRFRLALSTSFGEASEAGLALGAGIEPLPGWHASGSWSRTSGSGRGVARWDEIEIQASSAWREQAANLMLEGPVGMVTTRIWFESLDRMGLDEPRQDGVDPDLAWRAAHVALGVRSAGVHWGLEGFQGGGWQTVRVSRAGAIYGSASGPVDAAGVTFRAAPVGSRFELRATAGRWNAHAAGSLATWPFESLTAVTGTRLVASTRAILEHHGFQLERMPNGRGWDGGLALWHVSPRTDYQSWRATLYGIGRDDYRQESGLVPEVWMAGVRAALSLAPGGIPMRIECVQWVPIAILKGAEKVGAEPPTDPEPPNSSSSGTPATGGTILRLRVGS